MAVICNLFAAQRFRTNWNAILLCTVELYRTVNLYVVLINVEVVELSRAGEFVWKLNYS
jgi:hypothetical protein